MDTIMSTSVEKNKCGVRKQQLARSSLVPHQVPALLEDLTQFILSHVESEGLFRVAGGIERTKRLQDALKRGGQIPADQPVHDVCTVLKRWVKNQKLFKDSTLPSSPPTMLEDLRGTMAPLASENVFILKHLCKFLSMVACHSKQNRMNLDNLAGIFGENVLVNQTTHANLQDLNAQLAVINASMKCLVENADILDLYSKACTTPERNRNDLDKKSFTTRMKLYGSALKNLTKRRSLSLDRDFNAFPLTDGKERYLIERRGTITQDTEKLLERRHRNIERRRDLNSKKNVDKENIVIPSRRRTFREHSPEETPHMEWKALPQISHPSVNHSTAILRCRSNRT